MRPDRMKQMMAHLTRPGMARGGRIGFKYGSSTFDASTKMEDAFKAYKN